MSSDDDIKQVIANVPEDIHQKAKDRLEHGGMTRVINEALETVAYGGTWDSRSAIDIQLNTKRQELKQARSERRAINTRIENLEDDISDLEQAREEQETEQDRLEGALWSFEQTFRSGETRAVEENKQLQGIATEFRMDVEDVIDALRERNPDVPDAAFKPPALARGSWNGLSDAAVSRPAEERHKHAGGS